MLLSTKFILEGLEKYKTDAHLMALPQIEHHDKIKQWFINFDNLQIDKPSIVILEKEKAVVLYTNDTLWEVVQKWKDKKLDNFTMIDGIKIWKEIKGIMEKKG